MILGIIGATMSRTGLLAELVDSMSGMDTEASTLGPMSVGFAEEMEVDISMITAQERIHFPGRDAITIMATVTITRVRAIPVIAAMVIIVMVMVMDTVTTTIGTATRKHSLGWKRDQALTQAAIAMCRPSSMISMTTMKTMSSSPMMRTLDLGTAPD